MAGTFLDTAAEGLNFYVIQETSFGVGSSLQLTVTKTNNTTVTLSVTNTTSGSTLGQLTQQLINLVDSTLSLEGGDGLAAADLQDGGTDVQFDLRPNSSGYAAAQIKANLQPSSGMLGSVVGTTTLTQNLPDLIPRNHLYVTAGVTNLSLTFPLNTTTLADGYHDLAAVAYEGSHVRTQARATQTVRVQNTALSATFTNLVGGTNAAEEGTLQFQVAANGGTISKIELFGTGGSLGAISNLATVTFSVPGSSLDIGLHPFYAVVTSSTGRQYRTQTIWIPLIRARTAVRHPDQHPPHRARVDCHGRPQLRCPGHDQPDQRLPGAGHHRPRRQQRTLGGDKWQRRATILSRQGYTMIPCAMGWKISRPGADTVDAAGNIFDLI